MTGVVTPLDLGKDWAKRRPRSTPLASRDDSKEPDSSETRRDDDRQQEQASQRRKEKADPCPPEAATAVNDEAI